MNQDRKAEPPLAPILYSKDSLLRSSRFAAVERDALNAILQQDRSYSVEEAVRQLNQFMKREAT